MKKLYLFLIVLLVLISQLGAQSVVFRQEGIASWYGREFEGRPTASGEIFNSSQLTAAHPTLPFGTLLVVTNLHNNKSVTVRINDRGPFVPARIVDISRAAAEQLDMIVTGTAPVKIETVSSAAASSPVQIVSTPSAVHPVMVTQPSVPAQPVVTQPVITQPVTVTQPVITQPVTVTQPVITQPVTVTQPVITQPVTVTQPVVITQPLPVTHPVILQPAAIPAPSQIRLYPSINIVPDKNYRFQVGSFRVDRNAIDVFNRLKNAGLSPAYERFTDNSNIEYYRVVIAGIPGTDVQSTSDKLSAAGFREAIIREES